MVLVVVWHWPTPNRQWVAVLVGVALVDWVWVRMVWHVLVWGGWVYHRVRDLCSIGRP